jgi:hypothetical protein
VGPVLLRRLRSVLAAGVACGAVAVVPAAADAATVRSTSSNWAGYAIRKSGTTFRHVSGTWVQPAVDCTSGAGTYSSVWVGLGGYAKTSQALEQIGTEADCTATGRARYSTWYELVPDTSHSARIAVRPGDTLHASVAVSGRLVTLTIKNLTTGGAFTKVLRAQVVDTTAAEWIVEAPSLCTSLTACATTALAPFDTTTFTAARAVSSTGHAGAVADPAWTTVAIDLTALGGGGRRFADSRGDGSGAAGEATTGALDATGSSFTVTYAGGAVPTTTTALSGSGQAGTRGGPVATARR